MMLTKSIKMLTSNAHKILLCIFAQFLLILVIKNLGILYTFKLFEKAKIFLSTFIVNK